MCTDPKYFELFVSGSKYQHSNLFEQSNSSDSSDSSNNSDSSNSSDSSKNSDSSNSSDSSDSSDYSRRSKQQNRWLRLTENSKWRIRTQQTTLFNGIWYFGVLENPDYEFDVKNQKSKWRTPTANKLQKVTWFQWNSVLGGFRGRWLPI